MSWRTSPTSSMSGETDMAERKSASPIGVYSFCNTGSVLVFALDHTEDRVLAGINDNTPEWCDIKDIYSEETEELERGFYLGSFFIPFCDVMRIEGGVGN